MVPESQRDKQVFPSCCHPRVREHGTPSPSNVHYTAEAIWVYKHAWRGVGAYYRKGDHLQKKKTGNTPVEFKALRMFPEWERWIVPKPTFLAEPLLKEAATLEEKGGPKNRVKRRNIFEHFKDGFQPHTLTVLPSMLQAFKEYRERNNLNPNLGNLWGCFWESCNLKERGFWEAALEHHARHSLSDDGKVYHAITFGEDHPGYKPKDDELPSDKDCQVKEERTLRVASDKVQSWLDLGYTSNPDLTAVFPPSQEEANQATTASKKAGKGARKRPSSVPPGSDTAKAKQARAQADAGEKKAATEKVRIPTIPKQELSAIAVKLTAKVRSVVPTLNPKHYRTVQNLAGEWYKALYHTKFQLTKAEYLKHSYKTAEGYQRAKETNPTHLEAFIKALDVLKYSVSAPTTAGLRDPSSVQSDLAAAQQQLKPKMDKPAVESYAAAVTGQSATQPLPIGAKRPSVKASEKLPSGAIGPSVAKSKVKPSAGNVPAGTASTAKQDLAGQHYSRFSTGILANTPGDHTFADYQATQGTQPAQDTQLRALNRLHPYLNQRLKHKMQEGWI